MLQRKMKYTFYIGCARTRPMCYAVLRTSKCKTPIKLNNKYRIAEETPGLCEAPSFSTELYEI
jgi:hypothetical protein